MFCLISLNISINILDNVYNFMAVGRFMFLFKKIYFNKRKYYGIKILMYNNNLYCLNNIKISNIYLFKNMSFCVKYYNLINLKCIKYRQPVLALIKYIISYPNMTYYYYCSYISRLRYCKCAMGVEITINIYFIYNQCKGANK